MATYPWITFKLRGANYCITSEHVVTMKEPGTIYPLPDSGDQLLGLFFFNAEATSIPLISLRALLGMKPLQTDLDEFNRCQEQHLHWLEALEESVRARAPFPLPMDVHECEFGHWYDGFHPENPALKRLAEKIDAPHTKLHLVAAQLEGVRTAEGHDKAQVLLEQARQISEKELVPLLERLNTTYRDINRGIAMVLQRGKTIIALQADRIIAVTEFENCRAEPPSGTHSSLVNKIITSKEGELFFELDLDEVFAAVVSVGAGH